MASIIDENGTRSCSLETPYPYNPPNQQWWQLLEEKNIVDIIVDIFSWLITFTSVLMYHATVAKNPAPTGQCDNLNYLHVYPVPIYIKKPFKVLNNFANNVI